MYTYFLCTYAICRCLNFRLIVGGAQVVTFTKWRMGHAKICVYDMKKSTTTRGRVHQIYIRYSKQSVTSCESGFSVWLMIFAHRSHKSSSGECLDVSASYLRAIRLCLLYIARYIGRRDGYRAFFMDTFKSNRAMGLAYKCAVCIYVWVCMASAKSDYI